MKENVTAEVFPTLRNISLSRRTFVACAAIAAAQAALVSAGCAPEVQPSGEGLASTAAFAPGTYTASAPGKKGPVTVEVRMSENAIESVEIVEFEDTERISAPARERVPQQIVELQSLNVDTVAGATLTSMAIIEGVADCVNQANGDASALKKAASPEKSDETKEIQADLVVCGAGGAGMAAAVAAAQQGLDVVVFEKTAYAGGNALVSGGWLEVFEGVDDMKPDMTDGNRDMFHATLQKSLDNGVPKDFVDAVQADFDAYFAAGNTKVYDSMEYYALDYASRNGGPAKEYWLPYAHKVNDLNNWLFDQGYTVSGTLVGIVGFPWPRKAHAVDKENGEGFFSVFDNTVETQNLPITFLFETPVSELIVDGKKIMDDYWTGEQPRACIGQSEKYEILMLVIEGRYPLEGILGTSVNNCSEILLQHKCMQAINLDGGSSAMLWFDGEYVTQSSSSPLRYTGGRPLPNAWVYKKAQ